MVFYNKKLKKNRKLSGLTIEEMASMLGVSVSTIQSWENGRRIPKAKNIRNIANALNIKISDISDLKEIIQNENQGNLEKYTSSLLPFIDNEGMKLLEDQKLMFEQTLRANKEFLTMSSVVKTLINSMAHLFYVKNKQNKYVIVNKAFLDNVGLSIDYNLKNKSDHEVFPNMDAVDNIKEDQWVIKNQKPVINREGFIFGTRKQRRALYSKFPIFDAAGNVSGVVALINDITERQAKIDPLSVIETSIKYKNRSILIINKRTDYKVYYSKFAGTVYSYSDEHFMNNPSFWINNCIYSEDRDYVKFMIKNVERFNPIDGEYRIIDSKGELKRVKGEFTFSHYTNRRHYVGYSGGIDSKPK